MPESDLYQIKAVIALNRLQVCIFHGLGGLVQRAIELPEYEFIAVFFTVCHRRGLAILAGVKPSFSQDLLILFRRDGFLAQEDLNRDQGRLIVHRLTIAHHLFDDKGVLLCLMPNLKPWWDRCQ
jgi:hypothetical protein